MRMKLTRDNTVDNIRPNGLLTPSAILAAHGPHRQLKRYLS